MLKRLIKLADRFDAEGKTDLADAVDSILTTASRPKAPLKGLKEDVKKDLLKLLHKINHNSKDSKGLLEELGRRLRYFDLSDLMKELGLDKTLKDLHKVQECTDGAVKSMYSAAYGKSPSSSDLEQMADDFGTGPNVEHNPLEFFEAQSEDEDPEFEERKRDMEEENLSDISKDELGKLYEEGGPTKEDSETNQREWEALKEDNDQPEVKPEDLEAFWGEE